MELVVIVPTRGRPDNAKRLVDAFQSTTSHPVDLILGVDEDDEQIDAYLALFSDTVDVMVKPRLRMAGTLNAIAREVMDDYDIIGFMGDDHLPRTRGWDARIKEAMQPGGIVYCNDLIQGPLLPTEVFMDSMIIKQLGWMAPPELIHLYLDSFWLEFGTRLGRINYLSDVIIEHLHPIAQTAEWDEGYREVNSGTMYEHDRLEFERWMRDDAENDLAKVRNQL